MILLNNLAFPILSPYLTFVSIPSRELDNISLSISIVFFLNNNTIVEPPNSKYPFSSPFLNSYSWWLFLILPTPKAPISTSITFPKFLVFKIVHSRELVLKKL